MPKPKVRKYAQSAIASTTIYDRSPGPSKSTLYGFYSPKRERTWTGPARSVNEHDEAPFRNPQNWLLTKSVVPLKRDKR